jgi:hypothetical protein
MAKYIAFDLDDEKIGELADVLDNKTCKKIINFLSERDASEGQIAKALNLKLSTANYNIDKLVKSGLVGKKSFWWSVKGKKVPVYSLSNKSILISPKKKTLEGVKQYGLPVLLTGLGAYLLRILMKPVSISKDAVVNSASEASVASASGAVAMKAGGGAGVAFQAAGEPVVETVVSNPDFWQTIIGLASWHWFLMGAWFAIFLFFVLNIKRERR